MNDASFCADLLHHAAVTALVSNRIGLDHLKQGWGLPAVVYQIISTNERPYIGASGDTGQVVIRLQVNPLATTVDGVAAIHAAVRAAIQAQHTQVVDGHRLIHVEDGGSDRYGEDPTTGTWTRAADYLLTVEAETL